MNEPIYMSMRWERVKYNLSMMGKYVSTINFCLPRKATFTWLLSLIRFLFQCSRGFVVTIFLIFYFVFCFISKHFKLIPLGHKKSAKDLRSFIAKWSSNVSCWSDLLTWLNLSSMTALKTARRIVSKFDSCLSIVFAS